MFYRYKNKLLSSDQVNLKKKSYTWDVQAETSSGGEGWKERWGLEYRLEGRVWKREREKNFHTEFLKHEYKGTSNMNAGSCPTSWFLI